MKFVADLHIHSRYSRATSKYLTLEALDEAARLKGVKVLGTGDFTHPLWIKELEDGLAEAEPGLYKLKGSKSGTRFMLTCEVSSIYSKGGKVRKVHTLLFAPSFKIVRKINKELARVGNIHSDGRPILGLDIKELAKIVFDASENCMVIPAHAWTPWFSIFGSKSGFDSLEEAFEEMTPHIYAIETGLSSDPPMNWRLSALDKITLISNSDSHSARKIAREANVFDCQLSYFGITDTIKKKDKKRFLYTFEFFPEEGKYHYDGHRLCGICKKPTRAGEKKCPQCSRPMTIGVLSRIEELADRREGFRPKNAIPYKSLISLDEVLADVLGVGPMTKKVAREYDKLIKHFGNELRILLDADIKEVAGVSEPAIAEALRRMREGKINISPGYDGQFGRISILKKDEREKLNNSQTPLF